MHAFVYNGRNFMVYMSEEGNMAVKLPVIRRRRLDDVLNLPYDSLKLSFRQSPPPSAGPTRYRLSLSTGIPAQNGITSQKKLQEAASPVSALPDASGSSFLVQDSCDRPPSQELRPRALLRQRAPPPPPPPDLSGINVLQLELRQQTPAASWKPARPSNTGAASSVTRQTSRPKVTSTEPQNGAKQTDEAEETSSTVPPPPRITQRVQASSDAPVSASTNISVPSFNRRSPGRSCQLPLPTPSRGDSRMSYPDPLTGASNSFQQRVAEIALLEADTVRWERLRNYRRKPRPS